MSIEDFTPGPLPVIRQICLEAGIVEVVNEEVDWDEDQCVLSPGLRVMAIIMNLLTEGEALYRLPEFFRRTDVENLFGEGITPENLNDDSMARVLDKMSDAGPAKLAQRAKLTAADREGLAINVIQADTTDCTVHGLYEDTPDDALNITHGYNSNHRRLKQFKLGLGVNRDGVPLLGDVLDGNASDKTWNVDLISELRERIDIDAKIVYVADSAAVTTDALDEFAAAKIEFISRLPGRFNLVDALREKAWEVNDWTEIGTLSDEPEPTSYAVQQFQASIDERSYRFVVVKSSTLDGRAEKRINSEVDKAEENLQDAIGQLADRSFACEEDAHEAWETWLADQDLSWFEVDAEIRSEEQPIKRDKPGRPPKGWEREYETVYRIDPEFQRDEEAIQDAKQMGSCFVLITSLAASDEWTAEDILEEYKARQTVEQRFRFISDPKRVGPVYLNRPDRVEAFGYVLMMALLVYTLIERRVRLALADADEPMELTGGPTSFRPTGRRVLERFENMRVLRTEDNTREFPSNLDLPRRVLKLLGMDATIYGVDSPA